MVAKRPVAFRGVLVPLLTPFNPSGSVDKQSLKKLVAFVLKGGVHGVFACGTTGEGPNLTDEMWDAVVETSSEAVAGQVPVFVGCIDTSTQRVIEKAKKLRKYAADYAVVAPPFYFSPDNQDEIVNHFKAVAGASPVPVYVYNIPQLTKCHIEPETIEKLAEIKNIAGLKDSSGNFPDFCRVLSRLRGRADFAILQGEEGILAPSLLMGANGIVPGCANLDPKLLVELFNAAARGNLFIANRLQYTLIDLRRELFIGPSVFSSLKAAASVLGLFGKNVTMPEPNISAAQVQKIKGVLVKYGVKREAKSLKK